MVNSHGVRSVCNNTDLSGGILDAKRMEALHKNRGPATHQILTRSPAARIIGAPSLMLKACMNSGRFESGALQRKFPGECGSVRMRRRSACGRMLKRQICA